MSNFIPLNLQTENDTLRKDLIRAMKERDTAIAERDKAREDLASLDDDYRASLAAESERDKANQRMAALQEAYNYAVKSNQEQAQELIKQYNEICNHIASKNGWLCKYNETRAERDSLTIQLAQVKEAYAKLRKSSAVLIFADSGEHLAQFFAPFDAIFSPTPPSPTLYCQTCGHGQEFSKFTNLNGMVTECTQCRDMRTFGPQKPDNQTKTE